MRCVSVSVVELAGGGCIINEANPFSSVGPHTCMDISLIANLLNFFMIFISIHGLTIEREKKLNHKEFLKTYKQCFLKVILLHHPLYFETVWNGDFCSMQILLKLQNKEDSIIKLMLSAMQTV